MRGHFRLRPVWDPRHPAVRTVLRLSLWTFGAVMANQVAFNLVLIMAGKKSGDVVGLHHRLPVLPAPLRHLRRVDRRGA